MPLQTKSLQHYPVLDGLRGLAALAVVFFHRRWVWPGAHIVDHGYLAVDFFFLLSGFVIAHAYGGKLRDGMTNARFLLVRIIRLFPTIVIAVLIGGLQLASTNHFAGETLQATAANLFLIPYRATEVHPDYLRSIFYPTDPPLYSLFFEAVINVAFLMVARHLTPGRLALMVGLSLAALLGAIWFAPLGSLGQHPQIISYLGGFPRTAFAFSSASPSTGFDRGSRASPCIPRYRSSLWPSPCS